VASSASRNVRSCPLQQFAQRPDLRRNASGHRRRDAQRLVGAAEVDVEHQLAVAFGCDERVAIAAIGIIVRAYALLFAPDVRPHFIAFHVSHPDVADRLRHDALNSDDGATFHDHVENLFSLGDLGEHSTERLRVRFSVGALARLAVIARESVGVLAELPAFRFRSGTGHVDLDLPSGRGHNGGGSRKSLLCGFGPRLHPAGSVNYRQGFVFCRAAL
jgi:hypothetical protein